MDSNTGMNTGTEVTGTATTIDDTDRSNNTNRMNNNNNNNNNDRMLSHLLSRKVSFKSATIVTVSELYDILTDRGNDGRSIRVTARLLYQDYDKCTMNIADPLVEGKESSSSSLGILPKTKSYLHNPYASNAGVNAKRAISNRSDNSNLTGQKFPVVGGKLKSLPATSSSSMKRKHTIVSRPLQNRVRSNRVLGMSSNTIKISKRRNAFGVVRNSTVRAAKCISVDIRATVPLEECRCGDLVMVIGEVRFEEEGSDSKIGNLQARIVRNCNGVDVNLQHKAIEIRRKYLLERFGSSLTKKELPSNKPV